MMWRIRAFLLAMKAICFKPKYPDIADFAHASYEVFEAHNFVFMLAVTTEDAVARQWLSRICKRLAERHNGIAEFKRECL